jgi:hypothetical protein
MTDNELNNHEADSHDEHHASVESEVVFYTPSRFSPHTWLFRLTVVGIAYVTVAFCGWFANVTTSPLLQAIPPAAGVMMGFLLLSLKRH